jgi:hypothetical protein
MSSSDDESSTSDDTTDVFFYAEQKSNFFAMDANLMGTSLLFQAQYYEAKCKNSMISLIINAFHNISQQILFLFKFYRFRMWGQGQKSIPKTEGHATHQSSPQD